MRKSWSSPTPLFVRGATDDMACSPSVADLRSLEIVKRLEEQIYDSVDIDSDPTSLAPSTTTCSRRPPLT